MNMFARFDENPAMTLQDIKKTKRYGRTYARTHGQRENSIPTTNKVCRGYKNYNLVHQVEKALAIVSLNFVSDNCCFDNQKHFYINQFTCFNCLPVQ